MENEKKKKIVLTVIRILVLVVGIVGLTYAYFIAKGQSEDIVVTSKNLKIVFEDNTPVINATDIEPIEEKDILTNATKKTFSISKESASGKDLYVRLDMTDLVVSDNFKDFDFKWALYQGDTKKQEGTFNLLGSKTEIPLINNILLNSTTPIEYNLYIWIEETGLDQERLMEGTLSGKITAIGQTKRSEYKDNSGANSPKLASGMIPVIYDGDKWIKVNNDERYYDYNSLMWANAVTVTESSREGYMNAPSGTTISIDDINTMWVWIPRYKYKIPSDMGSSTNIANPPEIDVIFESGTSTTGVTEAVYRAGINSDGTNTNYYTHPAFRDGSTVYNTIAYDIGGWDKELTGIWVGKFETGTDNEVCNTTSNQENCKNVDPIIKPDIISLTSQDVSTGFLTSIKLAGGEMDTSTGKVTFSGNTKYGLTSSTDTHMMKNTEWGMVAILSQSKYGKMGNSSYEGENKEVYMNNSKLHYTGRSGLKPNTRAKEVYTNPSSNLAITDFGFFTYNNYLLEYKTNNKTTQVKGTGTGASTTGTIYGIYDMSGGAKEHTFGNFNGYSGSSQYNSGFNGLYCDSSQKTDGISFPESKYYDKYTKGISSADTTKEKAILGDATWETMYWYNDGNYFSTDCSPFSARGTGNNKQPGVFSIMSTSNGYTGSSFRISLMF